RRFLVVYDESNRLPREFSVGLLLSNSETLSAAGLVSVYAASPEMADSFKDLRDVCDQVVPLGPFRSRDDLRRLLERYYFPDDPGPWELPAEVDALDVLWERTRGLPFAIQLLAGQSFRLARDERCSRVTADHVERSCELLRKERPGLLA
ncbi:MAG TPA: hypothetical protein VFW33_21200, partial [Gemmataceae bacterium]|nr:hypothetical protein [Gemmataceae bacterium]